MKDEITIGLNGKTIASFGIELKGRIIDVSKVASFVVSTGSDEGNDVMNIRMGCILEEATVEEKKVTPIEPMVIKPDETVTLNPTPTPAPTYRELPIKTRKPRGPNKPKEEAPEKSVFERPIEEVVAPAVETPIVEKPVEEKKVPVASTVSTSARINELAKLIKMWCKASALKIETVTIALLKAQAFDIVENDSDETIEAGIKEAARLMTV